MAKSKINTSNFCFLEKHDACNTLSDASCSDDESLLLIWDEECAAKFAVAEKKKYRTALKQEKKLV